MVLPRKSSGLGFTAVIGFASIFSVVAIRAASVGPTDTDDATITYAETVDVQREAIAPTGSADDLLTGVLASAASPRILGASLGAAPPDFVENGYSGTWVVFIVDSPRSEGPATIRAVWDATLAAGALRDEMYRAGFPALEGFGILARKSDGTLEPYSAWPFGDIAYGQQFTAANARPAVLSEIREGVTAAGLRETSIEVVAPSDLAVAVVAQVDRSKIASQSDLNRMVETVFADLHDYEGIYLEIDDEKGKSIFVLARSFRTGDGLFYVAPELGIEPLRGSLRN